MIYSCGKRWFASRDMASEELKVLKANHRRKGNAKRNIRISVYECRYCGGFHIGHRMKK